MENSIYTVSELEHLYPNEWILGEVLEEDELEQATKVRLVAHHPSREEIHEKLESVPKGSDIALLFMGPPLREGYAAAFLISKYEIPDHCQ